MNEFIRNIVAPALPTPSATYSQPVQNGHVNALRNFFNTACNAVNQLITTQTNWNTPVQQTYTPILNVVSKTYVTYRVLLTGAVTINEPSQPSDGDEVAFWLTAINGVRIATLAPSIKIPSTIVGASPLVINTSEKGVFVIRYDATQNGGMGQWELISFNNGY